LVQYSQEHDAVLAFYYTDDNNRTQVCEIFDIENPNRVSTCHSTSCHKSRSHHTPLPPLIPENDDELEPIGSHNALMNSPGFAEDSGLSLTEDNSIPNDTNKRDACCSPVRHLSTGSRSSLRSIGRSNAASSSFRRSGALRRSVAGRISNGIPSSTIESGPALTASNNTNNVFSSDSDPDAGGEMLFVTNRRKRAASNDYDGGEEQSDTDHTF
jgi:hypothetical protein